MSRKRRFSSYALSILLFSSLIPVLLVSRQVIRDAQGTEVSALPR
ncbi:hypothetical protein [Streptomyces ziwulingensis]|uniref:Uncharacterized protein n=1 Tax=Streptomyces ziwulingensis TaxID=1045501 RepID=A0ABP9AL47_9ACTN